jgi:tetratricopeptide (TPR) repeat protein
VQKLLCSRPNAYWVEIADGGQWMNALHHRLCPGMPFTELLTNPIPFLRRRLDQVDLGSIVVDKPSVTPLPTDQPTASPQTDAPSPEAFRRQVVELLKTAEAEFEKHSYGKDPLAKIQSLEHQASLVYGNREWGNAIRLYTEIINTSRISATTQCLAHFRRGNSHGQLGDSAKAIADYSAAIDLPNAPVDQVAKALVNRGITHGQLGDSAKAIADYSAAIDLPNAPVDQVALALVNRGITHGQLGDSAKEIADYSAVITLPNAPADQVAKARSLLSKHRDDEGPPAAQAPKRKR